MMQRTVVVFKSQRRCMLSHVIDCAQPCAHLERQAEETLHFVACLVWDRRRMTAGRPANAPGTARASNEMA